MKNRAKTISMLAEHLGKSYRNAETILEIMERNIKHPDKIQDKLENELENEELRRKVMRRAARITQSQYETSGQDIKQLIPRAVHEAIKREEL